VTFNTLQYERERLRLGEEIRSLRKAKRVTGVELARKTKISQSKISKLETGTLLPSPEDLRSLLASLGASKVRTKALVESAQELRTEFRSWRFKHKKGLVTSQNEIAQMERSAKRLRVFQPAMIPGLLQLSTYARRVFELSNASGRNEIAAGAAARVERQSILFESQCEFLITEAAALSRFCDANIVVNQLEKIRTLIHLQDVRIGVLPNSRALPLVPLNSFVIFDSATVVVETLGGETSIVDPNDIELYTRAFDELASIALYGADAIPIIAAWKRYLTGLTASGAAAADPGHSGTRDGIAADLVE
jgi:transcriptional regulator with XRE-family HTH domain